MKDSSGRAALAAFAALLLYMLFVFPGVEGLRLAPRLGDSSFDLRFAAPPQQSLALAAAMDAPARRASIIGHWTFDLAYPLLYGAFFFVTCRWALRRIGGGRLLSFLTLAAPLLDLAENAAIAWLLVTAPALPAAAALGPATAAGPAAAAALSPAIAPAGARAAALLLSAATPAKWIAAASAAAITLVLAAVAAARAIRAARARA